MSRIVAGYVCAIITGLFIQCSLGGDTPTPIAEPESWQQVAAKVFSQSPTIDSAVQQEAIATIERVANSPNCQVPYNKMSVSRREAFQQLLTRWAARFPEGVFRTELQEKSAFDHLQTGVAGLFFIPVYARGLEAGTAVAQIHELKTLMQKSFSKRLDAILADLNKPNADLNKPSSVKEEFATAVETMMGECQPQDTGPLYDYPLSKEQFSALENNLEARISRIKFNEQKKEDTDPEDDDEKTMQVSIDCMDQLNECMMLIRQEYRNVVPAAIATQYAIVMKTIPVDSDLQMRASKERGELGHKYVQNSMAAARARFEAEVQAARIRDQMNAIPATEPTKSSGQP